IWKLRHALHLARLFPFIAGGAVGIPLGAEVLRWTSAEHMRAAIGLLLVLFSMYSWARPELQPRPSSSLADGLVGVASGLVGASTGLAGFPVIVWPPVRGWPKDEQRAVFHPFVFSIFAMTLIWFGGSSMLSIDPTRLFLFGLPAVALGTWL